MKTKSGIPRILTPTLDYTTYYPQARELAEKQRSIFWLPDEISVEKDIQDMRVNLSESEYHGVVTVLKLFTTYELMAGSEYWGDRVTRDFPRPDIREMANCFSFFELNVHAIFYNKINELLGLATPEFYNSYVDDPILKERMDFIDSYINHEDKLISLAVFTMVEGAILYSSFAFLKHFQNQGKNNLVNINAGIAFSAKDENLHSMGSAFLFRTLALEMGLEKEDFDRIEEILIKAAEKIFEHEDKIIDMIFEKGSITGITKAQLKNFVKSRINICMKYLGFKNVYKVSHNPIADWFYDSISGGQIHDFFFKIGSDYNRDYKEQDLGFINTDEE